MRRSTSSDSVRCRSHSVLALARRATDRTLVLLALLSAAASGQEIRSPGGRFLARVRPPADVEVVSASDPAAAPLWSAHGLTLAPAETWLLADDGQALVAIAPHAGAARPIVQIVRSGKLLASADAAALGLAPDLAPDWLARGPASLRLRSIERDGRGEYALDLLGRDSLVRRVDLGSGAIRLPAIAPHAAEEVRVELAAADGSQPVFVDEWFAPEAVFAGQPLPVHVRGSMPTPAWQFSGFSIRADAEGTFVLLTPRAIPPPRGTISVEVLKRFDETALVHGLRPGISKLRVSGRGSPANPPDERPVRVLPEGTLAFLERSVGLAGAYAQIVLFEDGRVRVARDRDAAAELFLASDADRAAVARTLARMPAVPARAAQGGEDPHHYELAWSSDGHALHAVRDDRNIEPESRALVDALDALASSVPTTASYDIDPFKSRVEVRTGSSGLLSAFGHEHRLMVQKLSGSIEVDPDQFSRSSLVLRIEAGSLAVVDDESQKDRPEIEKETNERVLESAKFPAIEFRSSRVELKQTDSGVRRVEVTGELALHGRTRTMRVPAEVDIQGENLHATGKVKLKQTEFGISPTSAVAGTVKVADEVTISFEIFAKRK